MNHEPSNDHARLDAWLASSQPPPPPASLRAAILAATPVNAAPTLSLRDALRTLWQEIGGLRIAAPAFALALAVGISLGNGLLPTGSMPSDPGEDLLSLALIHDDYLSLVP